MAGNRGARFGDGRETGEGRSRAAGTNRDTNRVAIRHTTRGATRDTPRLVAKRTTGGGFLRLTKPGFQLGKQFRESLNLRRMGRRLLDVLLPEAPPCPACHRPRGLHERGLCSACTARLARVAPPVCGRCGRPLRVSVDSRGAGSGGDLPAYSRASGGKEGERRPSGRARRRRSRADDGPLCRRCAAEPRFFRVARAPAVYEGAVKDYIHRFKYGGERELGAALGVLLGQYLERESALWPVDALVPVPLHPSRLEERGFNQAEILARVVGEWVGRPVWNDVLRRVRRTETQTRLSARQRRENVRDAFRPWRAARLAGRSLLLMDDVYTSGATVEEAARVLLKAGAERVGVLCLAVGVRPDEWLESG